MLAAAMEEFANAVEEYMYAAVEDRFKTSNAGGRGGRQGGGQAGGDTSDMTALKVQISSMQKQLAACEKANG